MKILTHIILFVFLLVTNAIHSQETETYRLFLRFQDLYNTGDFISAEDCMAEVLTSKDLLPEIYIIAAYNNMGLIKKSIGLYDEAFQYYDLALDLINNREQYPVTLADIYINKSRILTFRKSFSAAIEFLEKAIRIYQNTGKSDRSLLHRLSTAYLNIGIIKYELKDYDAALENIQRSSDLKLNNNLPETELSYLNLAKTYMGMNNWRKADEYFRKSIEIVVGEFGEEYYRLAEIYFEYGRFLQATGKSKEALEVHREALSVCLKIYGEKHPLVSLSYKYLGDHYLQQNNYDKALSYYQKALIAVCSDFNDPDIFKNPSIGSTLFNIRLLEILKNKARALELVADQQNNRETNLYAMQKSMETIELALQLIERIRNDFLSEESRIYLAENEKETYISAVCTAYGIFKLTGESSWVQNMYDITKRSKAAILRSEIAGNEFLFTAGLPDSLQQKRRKVAGNITAYNSMILDEMSRKDPDMAKIANWKDALFNTNREKEKLAEEIYREFPQYRDLHERIQPPATREIQKQLGKDETIIDYLVSNQFKDGKRELFIFVMTNKRLKFLVSGVDSSFTRHAEVIRRFDNPGRAGGIQTESFKNYTEALKYMYDNLINPVEGLITSERLIIIPDEEIAWLPFEAFIKEHPDADQTDYERLKYLIYDYTFSYGYSSSLIFSKKARIQRKEEVYAFSPDYANNDLRQGEANELRGAEREIESVFRWFKGKKFLGSEASETNFRNAIQRPAIFHLAMHSVSDTLDSRFSYLVFDSQSSEPEDGKLYNYEISLSWINSPMIVLSTCNSGSGTLYRGEGLMSIARGFLLAGASSVIKTLWDVNDETSALIISRFYYHLSKGKNRDEALRQAKLDYIRSQTPAYTDPYYWAAYVVLGDNSEVTRNYNTVVIPGVILIILAGAGMIYFRRRTIFSARAW